MNPYPPLMRTSYLEAPLKVGDASGDPARLRTHPGLAGRQLHPRDRPEPRRGSRQQIRAGEVPGSGDGELCMLREVAPESLL